MGFPAEWNDTNLDQGDLSISGLEGTPLLRKSQPSPAARPPAACHFPQPSGRSGRPLLGKDVQTHLQNRNGLAQALGSHSTKKKKLAVDATPDRVPAGTAHVDLEAKTNQAKKPESGGAEPSHTAGLPPAAGLPRPAPRCPAPTSAPRGAGGRGAPCPAPPQRRRTPR